MRGLPLDIGVIHFVGIGGIGMSGIAEILHNLGYQVRGSDLHESYVTKHLRDLNIPVEIGHRPDNLADAEVVVVSSAVKADNPEVIAARARLLPVVRRAEMLAELMRLKWSVAVGGTHGKTTTTSMVAALIDAAGLDPTVINGGIINNYGTNARLGAGDWMVAEADESDGTFVKLPAVIAIVTNMDPEHLDHYGSVEAMNRAYEEFVHNIPFYGFAVLCIDHPVVQAMIPRLSDRRIITYGFSPQADVRATDLRLDPSGSTHNVTINDRFREVTSRIQEITGIPAITMMAAQMDALKALGATRIAVATIYSSQVNEKMAKYMEAQGFQIAAMKGLEITDPFEASVHDADSAYRLGKAAFRHAVKADAILISCGTYRTFEMLPYLEMDTRAPVVSSNQATLWSALRKLGLPDVIPNLGKLWTVA